MSPAVNESSRTRLQMPKVSEEAIKKMWHLNKSWVKQIIKINERTSFKIPINTYKLSDFPTRPPMDPVYP